MVPVVNPQLQKRSCSLTLNKHYPDSMLLFNGSLRVVHLGTVSLSL